MRPTTGPTRKDGVKQKHSVFRNSSQPPKVKLFVGKLETPILSMNLLTWSSTWTSSQGMYINHDDLVTLATGPSGQGEAILQGLDRYNITFTFFTRFTTTVTTITWPHITLDISLSSSWVAFVTPVHSLLLQGDSKSQADRSKQQAASLITPAQGQRPWPGPIQVPSLWLHIRAPSRLRISEFTQNFWALCQFI